MRTGYSLLVDEYRTMLKPLRSSCISTAGRFARQCLANSCDGVERILVTHDEGDGSDRILPDWGDVVAAKWERYCPANRRLSARLIQWFVDAQAYGRRGRIPMLD